MEQKDTKGKIVKETFPSEVVSIFGSIFAGIILTILILPFKNFSILIIIVPALLSLRGNLSGPFIARTSRDLIIGEFDLKSWFENMAATYTLSLITALLIGIASFILSIFIAIVHTLTIYQVLSIAIISIILTQTYVILISTVLVFLVYRSGRNSNNIVPPIMTALGDFLLVFNFYLAIIFTGA